MSGSGGGLPCRPRAAEAESIRGSAAPAVSGGRVRSGVKGALNKKRWGWASPPRRMLGSPGRESLHPGCGPSSVPLYLEQFSFLFGGKRIAVEESAQPGGGVCFCPGFQTGGGRRER